MSLKSHTRKLLGLPNIRVHLVPASNSKVHKSWLSLSTMQKNWSGSINRYGLMYVCVHLSVCGADPMCLCVCGYTHPCACVWRSEEDTSVS